MTPFLGHKKVDDPDFLFKSVRELEKNCVTFSCFDFEFSERFLLKFYLGLSVFSFSFYILDNLYSSLCLVLEIHLFLRVRFCTATLRRNDSLVTEFFSENAFIIH